MMIRNIYMFYKLKLLGCRATSVSIIASLTSKWTYDWKNVINYEKSMRSQRSTNGVGTNLQEGGNTTEKAQGNEPNLVETALDQGCFSGLKLVCRKIKNKCKKCFKKWTKKLRKTVHLPAQGSTETLSSNTTVPDIIESSVPVSHPPNEVQNNHVDDITWEDVLSAEESPAPPLPASRPPNEVQSQPSNDIISDTTTCEDSLSAEGSPAPLPDTCEITYQTLGDLITFENLMGEGKPIIFYDIFEEYCKETEGILPSYDAGMLLTIRGRPISNSSDDQELFNDQNETDIPPANTVIYSANPIDPSSTTAV